ncbi:MAG: ribbon-helix-helix protein, CopG family [Acidobacteriota bacterium]|nr:MAG: ribbon-helix-helix protein, CopG family [Acidobacteriota bacterium]
MSHRLQVLIPEELHARIRKAAQRCGVSKGEWVRRAIEAFLIRPRDEAAAGTDAADPLARLASLNAPTGDVDRILSEIESGRG